MEQPECDSLQMIQCTLYYIESIMFLLYLHILRRECDAWGTSGGLMTVSIVFLPWDGVNLKTSESAVLLLELPSWIWKSKKLVQRILSRDVGQLSQNIRAEGS